MKQRVLLVFTVCASCFFTAHAYEQPTHEELSQAAAFASVLGQTETLKMLGLYGSSITDTNLTFPNSQNSDDKKTIRLLIRDGARFEDNFPRPLNHFFDPLNGTGMGIGYPSPPWALEDQGDVAGQNNSYKDARSYFYDALTKTDNTERKVNWGNKTRVSEEFPLILAINPL